MSVSAWGRGRSRLGKLHVGKTVAGRLGGLLRESRCGRGERVVSVETARQVGPKGLCATCARLAGIS